MAQTKAINLTCEYQPANMGVDTPRPRFSWWMDDPRPGAAQTAYRIQVAVVRPGASPAGFDAESNSLRR